LLANSRNNIPDKALIYYYFHDKETLYGATLENFFAPLHQRILEVCGRPGPAGEPPG